MQLSQPNFGILDTSMPGKIANSYDEGQQQKRQNALQELAYSQAMQAQADDQAMRGYHKQANGDMNRLVQLAMDGGQYKQAMDLKKMLLEQESKRAGIDKDNAEVASKTYKLGQDKKMDALILLTTAEDQPSWDAAVNQYKTLYPNEALNLPVEFSPKVTMPLLRQAIGLKDPSKLLPNVQTRNTGGTTDTMAIDPITGKVVVTNSVRNTQSPDSAASVAVQMRGQNMTDARARETLGQGKIPAGYRATPDGNLQAIPGGPADVKAQQLEQQKALGASDVDSAVATLRDAYDRLEKGGGITSTNKSGLSNLSANASSSAIGQAVGKALGTNNQSARNDIAMTRPALLAALMKATGMSAKQMDSNAELKLWLATATDPTLDVESNRRALDAIERKYISRGRVQPAGQTVQQPESQPAAGGIPAGWSVKVR